MKKETELIFLRLIVLLAGMALMILGIMRGELVEVLNKAVRICLECIGIG
ncbi:MAG: CD1871A family CXXC motif-containing protein [Oscillospiraceae bacterium]